MSWCLLLYLMALVFFELYRPFTCLVFTVVVVGVLFFVPELPLPLVVTLVELLELLVVCLPVLSLVPVVVWLPVVCCSPVVV